MFQCQRLKWFLCLLSCNILSEECFANLIRCLQVLVPVLPTNKRKQIQQSIYKLYLLHQYIIISLKGTLLKQKLLSWIKEKCNRTNMFFLAKTHVTWSVLMSIVMPGYHSFKSTDVNVRTFACLWSFSLHIYSPKSYSPSVGKREEQIYSNKFIYFMMKTKTKTDPCLCTKFSGSGYPTIGHWWKKQVIWNIAVKIGSDCYVFAIKGERCRWWLGWSSNRTFGLSDWDRESSPCHCISNSDC